MSKNPVANPVEAINLILKEPISLSFNNLEKDLNEYKWGSDPYNPHADYRVAANFIDSSFQHLVKSYARPLAIIMGLEGSRGFIKKVYHEEGGVNFAELIVQCDYENLESTIVNISDIPEPVYNILKHNECGSSWEEKVKK